MASKKSTGPVKRPSKKSPSKPAKKKAPAKRSKTRKPKQKKAEKDIEELQTLRKILKESHQTDSIGHAVNIMQENLNSYILLGYSFNGDPITAVAARTPQEYDALYSRAVQFVQQQSSPKSPSCGESPESD
jgi:hypothetical protein